MNPELKIIIDNFIIYVVPPIVSLIAAYTAYLINKLRIKVKEKNGDHALNIFDKVVDTVVLSLNQTTVTKIKEINKRKLSTGESKYLKTAAKAKIDLTVASGIKRDIKSIVKDYDRFLDDAIEAKVRQFKMKNDDNVYR